MSKVLLGQMVAFGAEPHQLTHETRGAIAIGEDGTILWRGPLTLLPRAFDHTHRVMIMVPNS
jgi:guanine deaminase